VRDYYAFLDDYYQGPPWDRMRAKLDAVRALCRQNNSELRIVVFPFLHNLGPDYTFLDAHRKIIAYGNQRNIPVLDLEPILAPHVPDGLRVNRFDAHPNERAHELAAQALLNRLIPAPSR
ncbi:MAG: SGNH/GDSL hydrolase family protein, partial [Planctomycetaceae bacterium]